MSHSLERLYSPGLFDIIFPFFAFFFVILVPSVFAVYVIVRVLKSDYSSEDKRMPLPKNTGS